MYVLHISSVLDYDVKLNSMIDRIYMLRETLTVNLKGHAFVQRMA